MKMQRHMALSLCGSAQQPQWAMENSNEPRSALSFASFGHIEKEGGKWAFIGRLPATEKNDSVFF